MDHRLMRPAVSRSKEVQRNFEVRPPALVGRKSEAASDVRSAEPTFGGLSESRTTSEGASLFRPTILSLVDDPFKPEQGTT